MKEQEDDSNSRKAVVSLRAGGPDLAVGAGSGGGGLTPPTHGGGGLVTLTQSDHEAIKNFLSSVPFPLSPGAALAELSGFPPPLSPGGGGGLTGQVVVATPHHHFHLSPSRYDPGSPGRYSESGFRSRNIGMDSPQKLLEQGSAMFKKLDHPNTFSPHRRSPSPPGRGYQSPYRIPHSSHVYAPILPSRAYDYTTPAPSPPPPVHQETLPPAPPPQVGIATSSLMSEDSQAHFISDGQASDSLPSDKIRVQKLRNVQQQALPKETKRRIDRAAIKKKSSVKRPLSGDGKVSAVTCSTELVALEKNSAEVEKRLAKGCSCGQDCFRGLSAEAVFKHRTNISRLTRGQHDMYLMGMMMVALADRNHTAKKKVRKRIRNKYIYQGSEVCQIAYMYLENVTIYHIKLIRKHVTEKGVVPRSHMNMGKKPANSIHPEHHRQAHVFLQEFLASENSGRKKGLCDLTFKNLYNKYKDHFSQTSGQVIAYTTFRKFVNKGFPHIKFRQENNLPSTQPCMTHTCSRTGDPVKSGKCGKNEADSKQLSTDDDSINLPPNFSQKTETQISGDQSRASL